MSFRGTRAQEKRINSTESPPFFYFFTLLHLLSEVFRVLPRLANPFT